jgi:hypothetical protein
MMVRIIIWSSLLLLPLFGLAQWSQPGDRWAYTFDGAASWVNVPTGMSCNAGSPFNWKAQFRPHTVSSSTMAIIAVVGASVDNNAGATCVRLANDEVAFFHYTTASTLWSHGVLTSTTANITANEWHTLEVNYNGTDLTVFVDGVSVISQASADFGSASINAKTSIGRRGSNGGSGDQWFDGEIDNARMSGDGATLDFRFSEGTGTTLANRIGGNDATITTGSGGWYDKWTPPVTFSDPTDVHGLVAWLVASDVDGDGNSGNNSGTYATWVDLSGNGNNFTTGISFNEPTYVAGPPDALNFDGVNDKLNSGAISSLNTENDYVIYVVAKADVAEFSTILALDTDFADATAAIQELSTGSRGLRWNTSLGIFQPIVHTPTNIFLGALYWESNSSYYKVNSTSTSTNGDTDPSVTAHQDFFIGGQKSGGNFDGDIYEVIIYQGILSSGDKTNVENYLTTKYGL